MRLALFALSTILATQPLLAQTKQEDPDAKAARVEAQMTDDERFSLLSGIMPIPFPGSPVTVPAGVPVTAGYVPGIDRLGIAPQLATDASLGVTNPGQLRKGDVATAMPSGQSLASSFDPAMAERVGTTVGAEARAKGFNILLGGGMNLSRDPRNGRNFEYLGEDPLLAGTLVGHAIRGTQSQGVVSTIKHFAMNAQETLRFTANSIIAESPLRESELLGFQIGIEVGQPGSVMCAYNLVNGAKSCGNDHLLNTVLKRDWRYKGWVMSDWGAVNDASYFMAGLDQQEGSQLDQQIWFGKPLRDLVASGAVPRARVSDAVRRMLRSFYAVGITGPYQPKPIDYPAHAAVALDAARGGIVLLKNDGVLPLAATARNILIVGGNADFGVLSGAGSSQVTPSNGTPRIIENGGEGLMALFNRQLYMPSSPLKALRTALPNANIEYVSDYTPEIAAAQAAKADMVIIFGTKWQTETLDAGSLSLPQGQDDLIAQVAAANPRTVVVLETGNPVDMPWLDKAAAVVEAWYPGQEGGTAIADVLTGKVNPSGRLPVSFPRSLDQYPRKDLPGLGLPDKTPIEVRYDEGADIGYRAYAKSGDKPLFPFGFGLSYTRFGHSALRVTPGATVKLNFTVRNDGDREGADVPQVYLVSRNGAKLQRLVGFQKLVLKPGESRAVTLTVDNRLLADWKDGGWSIAGGSYGFALGKDAETLDAASVVKLPAKSWKD
ncbi:glycoside hydrolase family 3 C-terminal domain-containing protein [Sphingobium sp. BYY-5]|uniref:beta-glucosidase n=1 Tax=Sphingobium sp. BYY-5 TaxID=2926400 RepID=UPI001FA6EFAB|nr:glycoside hydrolase family 3 C-terminal domain-containing protein [Sphingobium sp. BYY-5]MCI4589558.1 glycoside hydrolase family 3 C-terminal domain-containing protein [Sphingobium sp. BYY-5]